MLTILEGPDCSGKTTLMKSAWPLQQDVYGVGTHYHHFGPPSRSGAFHDYSLWLLNHDMDLDTHNVIDRFIYGERIYSRVLGRGTTLSAANLRMLERVCLSHQAVLVACLPKYETGLALWQERIEGELLKKEQQYQQTYELYRELFDPKTPCGLTRIRYDLETTKLEDVRNMVRASRPGENVGPGIGNFSPGVTLMVGETVNENKAVHSRWPFVADGGSSEWLAQQLNELKVLEKDLYWINALTDGQQTDPGFVSKLKPGQIIALGKSAEIWCNRHKLDNVAVPHPAFWKRFHSTERYPLLDVL